MSFEFYEGIVQKGIDDATQLVNQSTAETGQQRMNTLLEATKRLDQSFEHFSDLQNVLLLLPTNEKTAATRRVQLLDTRMKEVSGRIETGKQRAKLLSGSTLSTQNAITEDEQIEKTQNAMGEAYEIGTGILVSLKEQHNKLANAKENTDRLSASVNDTAGHVTTMEKIAKMNKIILYVIIGMLLVGIFILLYLKF